MSSKSTPELKKKSKTTPNNISGDNPNSKLNTVDPQNPISSLKPETHHFITIKKDNKEFLASHVLTRGNKRHIIS
jgi:hypothetical protein